MGNSTANAFPLLLLAGSSETHLVSRGAFQELDAISLLTPHTKLAVRPSSLESIPSAIQNAYRSCFYGRPGTGFVDLPANLIQGLCEDTEEIQAIKGIPPAPKSASEDTNLGRIAELLKSAKAPLIVIGKGAAYAKAENAIRNLINQTHIPFLPTPMGKGVVSDSHPSNTASARSTALKEADVVLILGARLNWILHFGDAPKWNPSVTFIQIDISPEEIGRNRGSAELSLIGDVDSIVTQLTHVLGSWHYISTSPYLTHLSAASSKNEASAALKAQSSQIPMTYSHVFTTIKDTLHALSPPENGSIVYISEGANTMDISRSIFPVSHPRLRLDAGTYATMGVGLGYAIAAHCHYNTPPNPNPPKKIIAFEGDSAFGFSAMEIETMARYNMPILIFVLNNGGVYHGDSDSASHWLSLQHNTASGAKQGGLRSTSLGWEVGYEKIAEMCGGRGFLVRTPEELVRATREGFESSVVCVVNVIIEAGSSKKLEFGWQSSSVKAKKGAKL